MVASRAKHAGITVSDIRRFSDIWTQLKREYGCVSTYKSIKRKYIDDVHEFIDCYVVPKYLDELIHDANAQQSFA